ncbi:MAG: 30S ribosome-binding factor RbfA [Bacteroidales bacterium]|jgi:ribosome-binding factor A
MQLLVSLYKRKSIIMDSKRQLRVSRLLQKELGDIFQEMGRSVFTGNMISVTRVTVTPDLEIARVYLSLYGKSDKKVLIEEIKQRDKAIRLELGNRIKRVLRVVPELVFILDDSLDYIENIEKLLKQ